jgi:uncharacterized Zn finger protein (UPF0148 family)
MSAIFPLEMAYLFCAECGLPFAAPLEFVKFKDGEICCPNGHGSHFNLKDDETEEKESEKVQELRRNLVRAIHDREQAEARASEIRKPATARRRKSDAA